MSVGFGLPIKSLQRYMRLHINCTEFGQPWASITFMLNFSEKYEMEITFSIQAFFPKLCRDALIPTLQHRMALVWLSFPSLEVCPAFAVRLQPWVIFSLTAACFIPPFSAFFLLLFVLKIYHTQGSQKQPHTQKNGILVDAKIGVSVSWVVQSRNKTLMQMWFIYRQ